MECRVGRYEISEREQNLFCFILCRISQTSPRGRAVWLKKFQDLILSKRHPMESPQCRKTDATTWSKKRAFTSRYLETVWPRSYWNTGPLSFPKPVTAPRCFGPPLSPKSGKGRPRFAWDANGRRTKSLEPGTLASSSEQPKEPKVPKEPKEPEEPGEPEPEEPEKPNEAELALLRDTMVHRVLPEPLYTHSSDRCFLVSDKKRQEVYLKMSQIGSLKLILAQVEVATGYKFEDGVRDFRSNLC